MPRRLSDDDRAHGVVPGRAMQPLPPRIERRSEPLVIGGRPTPGRASAGWEA